MIDDLRLALRSLVRRPGFTVVAVLTLALGIGANTAIFSVVNRLMLNPLPFDEADRLVAFWRVARSGQIWVPPSVEQVEAVAAHGKSFESVAPFSTAEVVLSNEDGSSEIVQGGRMTEVLPGLLRVRPVIGRFILREETVRGGAEVAVLGHGFWRRRYGGDPAVLGERIVIDGKPHTIVGVMDAALDREQQPIGGQDVWTPQRLGDEAFGTSVLARLRPGVTIEQADAELKRLAEGMDADETFDSDFTISARAPVDASSASHRMLLVMLGAVAMVLLVACANVANLLLARAAARRHEIGIRLALGASRARLVRSLLVESIVLALAGGALGILLAVWGIDTIAAIRPDSLDELASVTLDPIVLWFTVGVSVLAGVIFGLVPAIRASRPGLTDSLRSGSAGSGIGVEGRRLRSGLVVLEVALSVVLLVSAGLLVRSLQKLQAVEPGYEPRGLLTARLMLPESRYASGAERERIAGELVARVRAMPQVEGALVSMFVPPNVGVLYGVPRIEGGRLSPEETSNRLFAPLHGGAEFFSLFRVRLVEGRPLDPRDPDEAVVNERLAKVWWPGESAIGKRFALGEEDEANVQWRTVVGVAGDILTSSPQDARSARQIYGSAGETPPWQTLVVRVKEGIDPMSLAPAIQSVMTAIDPLAPLREITTTEVQLARTIARPRFTMALLTTFALLALLLSAIGLYGVISYTVSERTREIGIRMALGARPQGIFGLVLRQGLTVTVVGIGLGIAGALAGGTVLAGMLYEVGARDPLTMASVVAMVLAAAVAAVLVPARRATRVDPAGAMRVD